MKHTPLNLSVAAAAAAALMLSACGDEGETGEPAGEEAEDGTVELTVGASPVPHADILQFIDDELAEEAGLSIEVQEFDDYNLPNEALDNGDLDANYFQHEPWFDAEVEENGYDIVHFDGVHIEPFALYSSQHDDTAHLPEGSTIALNNDPSNQARGLVLLAEAGLIEIDEDVDAQALTLNDITENPSSFEFIEADAAALTRTLDDVDAAVINGNNALEADLSPTEDGLLVEDGDDNPHANFLAVRTEHEDDESVQALQDLLTSDEVRDYIEENWTDGEVLPAF
ncbi:MetQ/NlpA family ABC transporter substrate-binding protein [Nesterenkonia sp. NBAIMH1]|uniref:MetQ/NlpA family ABC transporter substrate-binding protein n=1 Tax=Nesterenkonia sp. NBAIMH1 TaxID=2600320 RepID=UPI0011B40EED|nr:MetQ/NlpA family ABC transporter substrate-binding protein [Nesterenkonia sp. NBAIMH1]